MFEKKFNIKPKDKFEIVKMKYPDSALISTVIPIEKGSVKIEKIGELESLVEMPLLEACKIFQSKGIVSVFSSANQKDILAGYVHIALDFEKLNQENKVIALNIGELGLMHGSIQGKGIYIKIPITEKSTVGEVVAKSTSIAEKFVSQL